MKLGHTNPTRSNSGLQALILMAYEFHGKRTGPQVKDLLDEKFQSFVAAIEKGVPKFGESTGTFMEEMLLYGPSKYDLVVTYENLAIQHIPNAQGRWGNLRVFYPAQTMWSSHPIAVLNGAWVTPAERAAAATLIAFLRDKPEQQRALAFGFRPANPEVPVLSADGSSPFKGAVRRASRSRQRGRGTAGPHHSESNGDVEPKDRPLAARFKRSSSNERGQRQ